MKQLRLLMVAFAAVFSLCANAQDWKGNIVADGTFYLYNIGSGQWLCAGNDWGTRASVNKTGDIDFIIAASGEGFTLDSQISNGGDSHFLKLVDGGVYTDQGAYEWTFTQVSRQDGVIAYIISNDKGNLFFMGDGTIVDVDTENGTGDNAQWVLVSLEDRLAKLKTATDANPVDATFLIKDPNFGRNNQRKNAWTIESNNSNLGGGAANNNCAEVYMSAFTLTQELNVPNGLYRFTGQGAVTYHDNRTVKEYDGGAKPELYLGDAVLGFEEMTTEDKLSNMTQLSNAFTEGRYNLGWSSTVSVAGGKVNIGARSERADIWAIWDNFQLEYLGELQDLGPIVEAYEKALAEAKDLLNTTETCSKNALSSLRGATILNGENRVDKNSKESLEAATKALNDAIAAVKTSIESYKVIAAGEIPSNNIAGWTCTNTGQFHINTWSSEGNSDGTGMTTPFVENWVNSGEGSLGDGMIYYTLEGLQSGEVYYAQALVRAYSEAGNEIAGISFFVNDDVTDIVANGNPYTFNGKPGVYGTFGNIVTIGTDGILTIGVKLEGATFNWVAIKNVSVQSMEAALQASVDKVEAYYGKIPTAVETETKSFVETTKGSVSNNETFQAAVNALNNKANELAPISKEYEAAKALADYKSKYYDAVKALADVKDYKELTAGAHDKLELALNSFALPTVDMDALNALTTAEAIKSFAEDIDAQARYADDMVRAAGIEYNNNAAPTKDAKFDITFILTNANLEGLPTWQKCQGWESERTTGNSQVMVNGDVTSEDGTKTAFYEYWSEQPAADGTFTLYQNVALPAGKYEVSCYAFAAQPTGGEDCNVRFYANDIEGPVIASTRLAPASFDFELANAGDVKIGLKALEGNFFRWMGIGYMELSRGAQEETVEDPEWKELVINGNVEGEDGTSLVTQDGEGEVQGTHRFNPVEGAGIDGSKAAVVHVAAGSKEDWTGQFFIYEPSHVFQAGEKYKVSFWVKADKPASVDMQAHTTPGNYIGWYVDGAPALNVTTEWQEVSFEGTITDRDSNTKMSGMQTIAFNLSKDKENENNFYFDNISWKLYQGAPFEVTFDPVSGTEVEVGSEITMSFDGDVFNCHYTTDGSDPKTSMTMMTAMPNEIITVKGVGEFVIKAYLVKNKTEEESDVITATYPIKGTVDPHWQELVINGDAEGEDGTSLVTQDGEGEVQGAHRFNPVEGAGIDGSKAAVVHIAAGSKEDWTGQFFIYEPSHVFQAGEKYKVSFWVKADKPASVDMQAHTTPGNYIGWYVDGAPALNVTTEWQFISFEGTVTDRDENTKMSGMQTIAFNLSKDRENENNFYFDNVSWKLYVEPAKDIELTEDDTQAPEPGKYGTITFKRKMLMGLNTIVLPFDYTIAEIQADRVARYTGTTDRTVHFSRVQEEEILKANVPYVVQMVEDKELELVFENKTVVEPDDLTVIGGDYDLVGSYKAYAKGESPVKEGDYIVGVKDLLKAKGGNEHKAYRAYLKSNVGVSDAPLYIAINGDVVNGISNIEADSTGADRIYNLNGQRVNGTQKGIYIVNGKKVVLK